MCYKMNAGTGMRWQMSENEENKKACKNRETNEQMKMNK